MSIERSVSDMLIWVDEKKIQWNKYMQYKMDQHMEICNTVEEEYYYFDIIYAVHNFLYLLYKDSKVRIKDE